MFEMKLRNHHSVPPGNWRYKHPVSGHEIARHTWDLLRQDLDKHCEANGYPLVSDAEIEQQMCENYGSLTRRKFCEGDGVSIDGVSIKWQDLIPGLTVLGTHLVNRVASVVTGESPYVSQEEAERRAAICAPCSRNVRYAKPCGGDCPELETAIEAVVGKRSTTRDLDLNACAVCKCALKSAVHVPIEVQAKGVTPEMMEQFPAHCWKAAGIRAL